MVDHFRALWFRICKLAVRTSPGLIGCIPDFWNPLRIFVSVKEQYHALYTMHYCQFAFT